MRDYKSLTKSQLRTIFEGVPFKIEPMWHQYVSLAFACDALDTGKPRNRIAYLHGVGTGKTLTALWTMWLWGVKKFLVVCPISGFEAWERDTKNHTDLTYTILTGSADTRKGLLENSQSNCYIINYEGLKSLLAERVPGVGWQISKSPYFNYFEGIVFDEMHKLANYSSKQYRLCLHLSKNSDYIIGMTATPIANTLMDLWGEFSVIDLGESLGRSFWRFRSRYFNKYGFEYKPKSNAKEQILNRIANRAICFTREECLDLPESVRVVRKVKKTQEFRDIEDDLINTLKMELGGQEINVSTALARTQKLLQLCGGFVYYQDDNGKRTHRLRRNLKIVELIEYLKEVDERALIVYHYTEEGEMITEALSKNSISFASPLIGTKNQEYKRFISDKDIRCFVAQISSVRESYDFSSINVLIFYSNTYSFIDREQVEGRILRKGQKKNCIYVDPVVENSIDEIVIQKVEDKKVLLDKVLEYINGTR